MIPPTSFVFDRQRIVVAGEDSPAVAFAIATLRRDGHCVTHAPDSGSVAWDLALRDCHLLITAAGIGDAARTDLLDEVRHLRPKVALLCFSSAPRGERGRSGRWRSAVATLREPFTAEELRAAVRPLLPQLRVGSVLAREVTPLASS